jgi:hypothetical protein
MKTMLKLKGDQRMLLADKLCDAANLAAGALVLGQFLGTAFSIVLACAGVVLWAGLIFCALALTKGKEP